MCFILPVLFLFLFFCFSCSCLRPRFLLPLLLQQTTFHQDTSKSFEVQSTGFILDNFLIILLLLYLSPSQTSLRFPSVDLASLLPKAGVDVGGSMDSDLGVIVDGPSAEDLGQSLVFTNSHHNGRTATHSYAHATANSYAHAASGGTTYAHSALVLFAPHTHTFYVTTSIFPISVFSSSFDFIHSSSPQFWALVLGP